MDFFRKYQRIILYTAGIFALVSFSISGPILTFFASLTQRSQPMASMKVEGRDVAVTVDDIATAQRLVQRGERGRSDLVVVLPTLFGAESTDSKVDVYAALRRLAIEYGLEYSDDEVDRAIDNALRIGNAAGLTSVNDLWRGRYESLSEFRHIIGESLRISTFVRLQAMAIDTSLASVADSLSRDLERVTLDAAVLDEKALQTAIEQKDVSDEDLGAWIASLTKAEQNSHGFLDQNRYKIDVASLANADFDPANFAEELAGKTFSDDEVSSYYELNKFRLWQKPKAPDAAADAPPEYDPLDDALKVTIRQRLGAEAVLKAIWDKVTERLNESIKAEVAVRDAAIAKVDEAQKGVETASVRGNAADATEAEKKALTDAMAAVTAAKESVTSADKAVADKLASFDSKAAFEELAKGRKGLAYASAPEQSMTITQLESIEPVKPWTGSAAVAALTLAQPLTTQVQRSAGFSFHVRLRAIEETPLKPLADIRDKARTDWFTMKAGDAAKERTTGFEDDLKALSRAKIPERIAELEKERDTKLETKVADWKADIEKRLAEEKTQRDFHQKRDPDSQAFHGHQAQVDKLEAELAKLEDQRKLFLEGLQKECDDAIAKAAKAHYGEVLAEAAAKHEFTVSSFGPYPRELFVAGRSRDAYPEAVQFLFGNPTVRGLEQGDATDVLPDAAHRKRYLAVCTKVEKGGLADITRRQLLDGRESAEYTRMSDGVEQSFSIEALTARWDWHQPNRVEVREGKGDK
ncbi:MAG: hypothetical protein U1F36_04785 [Planctomycetota bacterium]